MLVESKVTLGLIFAVVMQTAGALMWAGSAQERMVNLERSAIEARPVAERLARVETELDAVRAQLDRIENKIEIMTQRREP